MHTPHQGQSVVLTPVGPKRTGSPLNPETRPTAERWARDVLSETLPRLADGAVRLRLLRDGRKRLAVVTTEAPTPLVFKQYADDRGATTLRLMGRVQDAGLRAPSRHTITPALGWSPTHRTLVAELAPGREWAHYLRRSHVEQTSASERAADWLVNLQSLELDLPDRTQHRAADDLHRQILELAHRFPSHARHLTDTGRTISDRLYLAAHRAPLVPSHGDPHPGNLFLTSDDDPTVTAIDLDTLGLRRPSYDVGYAMAQVLISSWLHTGSFASGADAALAFWRCWLASGGRDADAVPAEMARTLIQSLHFELITYRTGRTELLDLWLGLTRILLGEDPGSALRNLSTDEEVTR